MRIQHNIMAMNAYRNYTNNTSAVSKNLEKLSSGYKINRAGDDAAGLAISEKMRAQITGLKAASKNVKDGVSLVKTAEGAMQEIHDMLNRMESLATQSANGTYDNEVDRANLQKEMDQLKSEINRIADSANFNGIKLLDGSLDDGAVTGVSYNKVDSKAIISLIPETGKPQDQPNSVDKDKTVVETDSTVPASKAGFEINLEGVSVTAGTGEKFTLTIGDKDLVVDLEDGKTYTAKDLADLVVDTYKDDGLKGFGDGTGGDFTITAEGSTLKFVSDTDVKLNTKADVTWKVDDGTTTPPAGGTKAKLEANVNLTGTAAANDEVTFTSDGATQLNLTFVSDGTNWTLKTGSTAPTGYTATFNGTKLTVEADAAADVAAPGPFGTVSVAQGGSNTGVTAAAIDGTPTFTPGVAAQQTLENIEPMPLDFNPLVLTPSSMSGDLADTTVGGTPAAYAPETNQVEGITVTVDADTATAGDVKVKVDKAAANKAAQATGADKLAGLTFKTADTVGRAGNDINIKIVASGATGTAAAAWDKDTKTVTVTLTSDGGNSGEYDAAAIQSLIQALGDKSGETDGGINFANFTVTAANSEKIAATETASAGDIGSVKLAGGETKDDMTVTLTSAAGAFSKTFGAAEWTGTALAVEGDKGVSVAIDTTKVTAAVGEAKVGAVSAAVGGKAVTLTTLDADAIKAAADATDGIADGDVTIAKNADGKLELKIGDKIIGVSTEAVPTTSNADKEITFTTDGTAQGTALGKITLASGLVANDITEAIDTGLSYVAASEDQDPPESEYIPSASLTGDMTQDADLGTLTDFTKDTALSADQVTALKTKLDALGSNTGKIVVGTTGVEVDLKDVTAGATKVGDIATKIMDAAKTAVEEYNKTSTDKKYEVVGVSSDAAGTTWLAGGPAENNQALQTGDGFYIQLREVTDEPTTPATPVSGGTINSGIQNVTTASAGETPRLANTVVDFSDVDGKTAWTDGAKITIGDTVYTVAVGDDSKFKNAKNVVHLTSDDIASKDKDLIAAEKLTRAAADNSIFTVGHDGKGGTTLQQRTAVKNTTDMSSREKIANYLGVSLADTNTIDNAKTGDGLTLQIGDTSETFNQLKVSIGDMHVAAMNLADVRIDNQTSAASAISAIKNAINYVSSVRGDLGATQNRLEHTANNLSVMTENIQDAESTIRDTDIAEEMMAYTKNNILVQSAQAMLAQANQIPQGVLQLLG